MSQDTSLGNPKPQLVIFCMLRLYYISRHAKMAPESKDSLKYSLRYAGTDTFSECYFKQCFKQLKLFPLI